MKVTIITFLAFIAVSINVTGQASLNQTDARGLRQGHWIKKNSMGHVLYEGYFKEGKPSGRFKRFYENDSLQSVLDYSADGKSANAVFYHPNGLVASKGKYVNQLKEGSWEFYSSYFKDYLICREEYRNNMKNGISVKFYPDSSISERVNYVNDKKSGEWTQYFVGGKPCLSGYYVDGMLDGKFTTYYDNGHPEYSGQYRDDARDGDWIKYNRDGSVKLKINYISGVPTSPELFKKETEYLDSLERNKGKIPDPEKTGTIWQ
ncbi:MAG TPA: hypothetical protein VMT63_05840 [Bacteroidales bacterium]|nr:hypothetical protein [Bacteroidales bacterium]